MRNSFGLLPRPQGNCERKTPKSSNDANNQGNLIAVAYTLLSY